MPQTSLFAPGEAPNWLMLKERLTWWHDSDELLSQCLVRRWPVRDLIVPPAARRRRRQGRLTKV
jgi:hypothetical protein